MNDHSEPELHRAPDSPTDLDWLQARADALRAAGRTMEADMVIAWRDLHAGRLNRGN